MQVENGNATEQEKKGEAPAPEVVENGPKEGASADDIKLEEKQDAPSPNGNKSDEPVSYCIIFIIPLFVRGCDDFSVALNSY